MSAEAITRLIVEMPVKRIEIEVDTLPLFSAEIQSKLSEAHLKIPKLLTDHSTVEKLSQRITQFNVENSLTLTDRAVRFVCTTLVIAAFAHFILGAAIIGQWGVMALGFGVVMSSPMMAMTLKSKVQEQQRQLNHEFLEVIDFFIEHSNRTDLASEYAAKLNEVKEYFREFLDKCYPKVSDASQTILKNIDPSVPIFDLDPCFQSLISTMDNSDLLSEFPNTIRAIVLGMLGLIHQAIQPGLHGSIGALIVLVAAILYAPFKASSAYETICKFYTTRIKENYNFFKDSERVEAVLKGLRERIEDAQTNNQNTDKLLLAQKEFIRAQEYYKGPA